MRKFALTALSIGLVTLAVQPVSAQMQASEGTEVSFTASVVDLSCKTVYNLSGNDHRMCAQVYFDLGVPVTMAMGQERGDKDLKGHAEHTVNVTGKVIERGGLNTILIESISMQQ